MPEEIKTLVVDTVSTSSSALLDALKPDLVLTECEQVSSLYKAIRAISESYYGLCLISDSYNIDDLNAFFGDVLKIDKGKNCLFVQVKDSLTSEFDRTSLKQMGFETIISRKGHAEDKRSILDAYREKVHGVEVRKRVVDVTDTLGLLLEEVDRVSEERRRGKDTKFNNIATDFVADQVSFDTEVLDSYYNKLTEVSETVEPEEYKGVKIPEEVLKKNLPHLSENTYVGASHRVWKKVKKKFGVKHSNAEEEGKE